MDNPYIGAIFMFGGNFAPQNFAFCNGQLLSISQNTALFAILGTTYGGNGTSNFALPNLQGRFSVHVDYDQDTVVQGQTSGEESVTLLTTQIPSHTHPVNAVSGTGNQTSPANTLWAAATVPRYAAPGTLVPLNPAAIGIAGNNLPHENMPPFLAVSFIIALFGVFPPRG